MAPEQARGLGRAVGPAADVYGLGAVLYELLTGRPPFKGESVLETLAQVAERDPAPPRLLNPAVPRDLEAVCLKCLEKDPARRYPSAAALADDLGRAARGEAVSVRSVNLLDRLSRALESSQIEAGMHAWAGVLFAWAGVVLAVHLALAAVAFGAGPPWTAVLFYLAQFLGMGAAYRLLRPPSPGGTERRLWALWLGYLVGCGVLMEVGRQTLPLEAPLCWLTYPFCNVLTGLAFVSLGAFYWGRGYVYAGAFFVLAVLSAWALTWAPLLFGLLWTAVLIDVGLHLRRLGRPATSAGPSPSSPEERGERSPPP
jgi:hypothetical protein